MRGAIEISSPNDRIRHPFEFPFGGRIRTQAPVINLALTNGARQIVFSKPPGTSGIVRNIGWIVSATNNVGVSRLANCTLEVKYDGSGSASISIPLFALGGMEYVRSAIKDLIGVSTPAFELGCTPISSLSTDFLGSNGNFRLPLPYTNGIEISVVAPATTDIQSVFFNVVYQDTLPGSWNAGLRLFADRSDEAVPAATNLPLNFKLTDATHAVVQGAGTWPANIAGRVIIPTNISTSDWLVLARTDNTHIVVSSLDTAGVALNTPDTGIHAAQHTFLNRPGGEAGYLAMIVGGYAQPDSDIDLLDEGNPRLWLDGNTGEPDLEWTSTEDFAMGCFNFEQKGHGEEGGVTCLDRSVNYEKTFYRVFSRYPIPYGNGIVGRVPQYTALGASTYRWTTFYYKQM